MIKRIYNTEIRANEGDTPTEINGTGAVVGVSTDLGYIEEAIGADAFREADLSDVLICFNHDPHTILGRTTAGTATVTVAENGDLIYSANDIDATNPSVISAVNYVKRGEVSKSSFMFDIAEETWSDSEIHGRMMKRTITKVGKVYETGPVTFPAYDQTDSFAREKDSILQQRNKWIEANETPTDHLIDDETERRAEWVRFYELTTK